MVSYIVAATIWRYGVHHQNCIGIETKTTTKTVIEWICIMFMHSIGACFNVNIVMAIASSSNNMYANAYYYTYYYFNVLTHFLFVFVCMGTWDKWWNSADWFRSRCDTLWNREFNIVYNNDYTRVRVKHKRNLHTFFFFIVSAVASWEVKPKIVTQRLRWFYF